MKHTKHILVIRDLVKKMSIASIEKVTITEAQSPQVVSARCLVAAIISGKTKEVKLNWTAMGCPSLYTETQWLGLLNALPERIRVDLTTVKTCDTYVKASTGEWVLEQSTDMEKGQRLISAFLRDGFVETEDTQNLVRSQMPTWVPKTKFEKLYAEAIASLKAGLPTNPGEDDLDQ